MLSKVDKPSDLTRNFFEVLADNGRLGETEKVPPLPIASPCRESAHFWFQAIDDFLTLMSAHRGELNITITSAAPLDSSLQSRLETSLKKSSAAQVRPNPATRASFCR